MLTDFMVVHGKLSRLIFVFAVAIAALIAFPDSQVSAYSVSGVVKDISGNVLIADATVTVKSSADASTNYTATTSATADASGNNYTVTLPSLGEYYTYSVTKAGYEESFPPSFPFTVSDTSPDFTADPVFLTQGTTYVLQLQAGWNLVSLPIQPTNTAISNFLADISGSYSIVWGDFNPASQTWKFKTAAGTGLLNTVSAGKAYWIFMTNVNGGTITVSGASVAHSVLLNPGWNFVGYCKPTSCTNTDATASITGNFSIIWGDFNPPSQTWKFKTSAGTGLLNTFGPGKGYWIYKNTAGDVTWTIP
jgi:hypothetical protein